MPPRSTGRGHAPAPALPTYAHAASRTALSLIVAEAHAEDAGAAERARFEAVERSASVSYTHLTLPTILRV